MGTFTFKWEHPAEDVYVTGTFDNWSKSVKLEKDGDVFQKTVDLSDASSKIYYKFVVDNKWTINETAPKESDPEGNLNNFLTPDEIQPSSIEAAIINTVTPESTTAKMAGDVPKETVATPSDIPGGFPATPADELNKNFSINPLPAADGAVNPIQLAPGEKIPDSVTASSINDNVKLDKESYEKSDALPAAKTELAASDKAIVPEIGLPASIPTLNSVAPGSSAAALAGEVPLEPKVPAVVKESQEKAGADPEASAVPEEVREKAEVEEELKEKVPEAPSTSEGTSGVGTEKKETSAPSGAAAASAGGAVIAAAIAAKDTVVEKAAPFVDQATVAATEAAKNLPESVKAQLPIAAQEAIATQNKEEKREEVSPEVPAEVKESITAAGESPEAAANTEAVKEKEQVEAELLKEVKPVPEISETKASETKVEEAKPIEHAVEAPKEAAAPATTAVTLKEDTTEAKTTAPATTAVTLKDDTAEAKTTAPATTAVTTKDDTTEDKTTAPTTTTETKPEPPANGAGNGAGNGTGNGTSSKPAAPETGSTAGDTTTSEKKKRHRVSAFFSKIKNKLNN